MVDARGTRGDWRLSLLTRGGLLRQRAPDQPAYVRRHGGALLKIRWNAHSQSQLHMHGLIHTCFVRRSRSWGTGCFCLRCVCVQARPDWDERRITDWVVDMWGKVFSGYYDRMPHIKASVTQSPVWWPWGKYPALGQDRDKMCIHEHGCNRQFNMQPYMEGLVNVAGAIGHPQFAFHSDYP